MKSPNEIKQYWENRSANDQSAQSTTMDVYIREIETNFILTTLEKIKPQIVLDVGCGDGRTTLRCAEKFPESRFFGIDYAANMIANAKLNAESSGVKNVAFSIGDVTSRLSFENIDFVYTTRCLQNLVDWGSQKQAIEHIRDALSVGGAYLMIENFIESHNKFNSLRSEFSLPEIPVRYHNKFFQRNELMDFLNDKFEVSHEVNISSAYYIVSRIIYASICKNQGINPDYYDIHHQLGSRLPFLGEYGPTRAITLKRII